MHRSGKINSVSAVAILPAAELAAGGDFSDSRASQEAQRAARYRLVIEEGLQAGSFIYKTMDRVTGEVIKQLPREQVIDLMRTAEYSTGSVIDTKA